MLICTRNQITLYAKGGANMKYILTYKAKRKNAKRHIYGRYDSIQDCMKHVDNKHYDFSIYTGNWELVYEVKPLRGKAV